MDKKHLSYRYADDAVNGRVNVPKYVKLQCQEFLDIADGKCEEYCINEKVMQVINELLKILIMPSGFNKGKSIYESLKGFQMLFIIAVFCTVERDNPSKRKYENVLLVPANCRRYLYR